MNTYVPKLNEVASDWWKVDAEGLTLGRLCTEVARRIRGKHKPQWTPHLDVGDHVIVINAEKVVLSGRKLDDKMYRRHTGYPGGLKEMTAGKLIVQRPDRIIEYAVRGMLPKGSLGRHMCRKLKVYVGSEHPHEAQQPRELKIVGADRRRN